MLTLVIGDKQLSSWSLRPWILLRHLDLPFEEVRLPLDTPRFHAEIGRWSPSGRVPVLLDGDLRIWDSVAICEYASELAGGAGWPADRNLRAFARSISAEMHSGFGALRHAMPMNIRASTPYKKHQAYVISDIARLTAIWEICRSRYGKDGPFLFGKFSIADAMFAPVVWRFQTYAVELPPVSRAWVETMRTLPAMEEWRASALAEPER